MASNAYGSATSLVVQLVVDLPPSIQTGLSNVVLDSGGSTVLAVSATGSGTLAYRWSLNGSPLTNTTAWLTLTNLQPSQTGYYSVTVTNQYGSISSTGRVSVLLPPSQVVAWGDNSGGQSVVPTNLDDAVAIAGGDFHSVAIRHNGTLAAWGSDDRSQIDVPTNSLRFVFVAAGADHTVAIAVD